MSVVPKTDAYRIDLRVDDLKLVAKLKKQAEREKLSLNTLIVRILAGLTPPPK